MSIIHKGVANYYRVSINEVYEIFCSGKTKYIFLDVRKPDEWSKGAIPGSLKISLDNLEAKLPELKKSRHYICICRYGGRSSIAAKLLADNGFPNIYNFQGGMIDWTAKNYPLEITEQKL